MSCISEEKRRRTLTTGISIVPRRRMEERAYEIIKINTKPSG